MECKVHSLPALFNIVTTTYMTILIKIKEYLKFNSSAALAFITCSWKLPYWTSQKHFIIAWNSVANYVSKLLAAGCILVNKDLLKHSHVHLCTVCGYFHLQQRPYGPQSLKYLLSDPWRKSLLSSTLDHEFFDMRVPFLLILYPQCIAWRLEHSRHSTSIEEILYIKRQWPWQPKQPFDRSPCGATIDA